MDNYALTNPYLKLQSCWWVIHIHKNHRSNQGVGIHNGLIEKTCQQFLTVNHLFFDMKSET